MVTHLSNLSDLQGRYLLLLAMKEKAVSVMDIESMIGAGIEAQDTLAAMGEAQATDLGKRLELIHKQVGCGEECHHKEGSHVPVS